MEHGLIIVFDGICNLCESSVNFVIRWDKKGQFKFAQAQSQIGIDLQNQYGINILDLETMILVKGEVAYTKSDAAIEIAKNLDGYWKMFSFIIVVPKSVRDWVYSRIAKNRYRWFGKKDSCMIPTVDSRSRFLE